MKAEKRKWEEEGVGTEGQFGQNSLKVLGICIQCIYLCLCRLINSSQFA